MENEKTIKEKSQQKKSEAILSKSVPKTQDAKEKKPEMEKKISETKDDQKQEQPGVKTETKKEDVKEKTTKEKETKKPTKELPVKKEEAVAQGLNLHASKKHCMYICSFIKNKSIDQAMHDLQDVIKFKKVVPFKGEIPHRSAPGIMSGRYPVKASQQIINILKGLRGNVITNGLDIDKTRIYWASASWASRPQKRGGMRFKRAHVVLKAKEIA